jgi:hypothetical protein
VIEGAMLHQNNHNCFDVVNASHGGSQPYAERYDSATSQELNRDPDRIGFLQKMDYHLGDSNLQAEFFEFSQRLRITSRIIDRVMRVPRHAKLFPLCGFGCVFHQACIQIADPAAGKAEWILSRETMEIVIYKLPIERKIVRYKNGPTFCVLR